VAVEFHPRAIVEGQVARRWYARRSRAVAKRFLDQLDRAVLEIEAHPTRWPLYLQGTRVYLVRRFPYLIVYRETPTAVQVVAIAHSHHNPGYWKKGTK
jgi:hypothetical protein